MSEYNAKPHRIQKTATGGPTLWNIGDCDDTLDECIREAFASDPSRRWRDSINAGIELAVNLELANVLHEWATNDDIVLGLSIVNSKLVVTMFAYEYRNELDQIDTFIKQITVEDAFVDMLAECADNLVEMVDGETTEDILKAVAEMRMIADRLEKLAEERKNEDAR